MGSEIRDEETATYVNLAAATVTLVDLYTIFGNATDLATGEPRKTIATVGIISGWASIALGGYVATVEDSKQLGIFLGLAGGISLGLGAFSARLAERTEEHGLRNVRVSPTLTREGDDIVFGFGLSGSF